MKFHKIKRHFLSNINAITKSLLDLEKIDDFNLYRQIEKKPKRGITQRIFGTTIHLVLLAIFWIFWIFFRNRAR